MKKNQIHLRTMIIVLLLLMSAFPIAIAADTVSAAQAGDYTYTISGGVATITGYTGAGGAITIPSTLGGCPVRAIGNDAFSSDPITSVTIPSSITSIGSNAFYWCDLLTTATIPSGLISIGFQAFAGCTALTSMSIPNSVTLIGFQAFAGCTYLTTINVGTGNPNYASINGVLYNKAISTLVQYPGGKAGVFSIPNSITTIGGGAFEYGTSLTSVTIPNSVTTIGGFAFSNNTALTYVTIGSGVTSIGLGAFFSCTSLTSIDVSTGNPGFASINGVLYNKVISTLIQYPGGKAGALAIPNSVTSIGSHAFSHSPFLTSVTIPDAVTSIDPEMFRICSSLTSIVIPNSVTYIGDSAFFDCYALTSVTIGSSVSFIGSYAFSFCTNLTSISFLGLTSPTMEPGLFDNSWIIDTPSELRGHAYVASDFPAPGGIWHGLTMGAIVPAQVGDFAYSVSDGVATITGYIGAGGAITIPSTLGGYPTTAIQDNSFDSYNGQLVESLTIPNCVTSIGDGAFANCINLKSVSIGTGITSLGNGVFANCAALTAIMIPSSVTSIGAEAFISCAALTSITIPDSVTIIHEGAFESCTALTSVSIGRSVTTIEFCAFEFCTALTSVTIPNNVTLLGFGVFAFCENMTSVTIGSGVTTIGDGAFGSCTSLNSITFLGLVAPATVGLGWISGTAVGIAGHAYAASNFPTTPGIWHELAMGAIFPIQAGDFTYIVSGGTATITGCTRAGGAMTIPSILGGYPVTIIGDGAFQWCGGLTSVTIPNSVVSINRTAFYMCESLTSVVIGKNVVSIGGWAFFECRSLVSITFLGYVAPNVTWNWGSASPGLTGHAYPASNFPAPGGVWNGLIMGTTIPVMVPGAPTNLSINPGNTQAVLEWAAPDIDGGSLITEYRLYRCTTSGGSYVKIVSLSGTIYVDTDLINGQTYWYEVSAVNSIGEGALAGPISTIPLSPVGPPTAPQNLVASGNYGQVFISWQAPSNDGGSPIISYKIYRTQAGSEMLLATVGPSTLNYVDNNVDAGTKYVYHVTAINAIGAGAVSAQASASTQGTADNTMLYAGVAIAIIAVIVIAVVVMRRKKSIG